jgi:transposase
MARRKPWRERFAVHPFANTFPMLSGPARAELRDDIRKHGVREPIVLWLDNREIAASGDIEVSPGDGTWYLVDGRNRLDVATELGIDPPVKRIEAYRLMSGFSGKGVGKTRWVASVPDAEALIVSMNVHRRHLTTAQKKKAIKAYAAINPNASDRKIARAVGVSHTTVAKARNGARNGQSGQNTQPIERALAVVAEQPTLSNRAAAKAADVSEFTIRKARARLEAETPKRKQPAKQNRDPVARRLRRELAKFTDEQLANLEALEPGDISARALADYLATVNDSLAALKTAARHLNKKEQK